MQLTTFVFFYVVGGAYSLQFGFKPAAVPCGKMPALFKGGLMGVSARVLLSRDTNSAIVTLSGIPVGGKVSGKARFGCGGKNDIIIDEPLKSILSRRFVDIVHAHHDKRSDRVHVIATLPLGLGTHTIVLIRSYEKLTNIEEVNQ